MWRVHRSRDCRLPGHRRHVSGHPPGLGHSSDGPPGIPRAKYGVLIRGVSDRGKRKPDNYGGLLRDGIVHLLNLRGWGRWDSIPTSRIVVVKEAKGVRSQRAVAQILLQKVLKLI